MADWLLAIALQLLVEDARIEDKLVQPFRSRRARSVLPAGAIGASACSRPVNNDENNPCGRASFPHRHGANDVGAANRLNFAVHLCCMCDRKIRRTAPAG
ncbi:hypothetical protein AWV79_36965 [Cupriavidus sp. UYMMa02A]|nr:hypothetical protein AWV79_36965 [Cupriavidus sp. UYMMa02A]